MITYEDISHLGMEVTDLEQAEQFYCGVMGLEIIHRDEGERGKGRLILQNKTGQLLFLEKAEAISPRARFCGPDESKVPDPGQGIRYKGAHLALSVGSTEDYDEIHAKLEASGVFIEGDIRAGQRAPGEKSTYFYDPFGNRFQLIVLPTPSGSTAGAGRS